MAITQLNTTAGSADAVQYSVVKNAALSKTQGKDVFNARVTAPVKSLQAVAETMHREGCPYKPAEITMMLTQFAEVTARLVNEGCAVNVGSLMRIRPSIRGTFDTEETAYAEGKQRIVVKTTVGSLLRDVAAQANVRRIDGKTLPQILAVLNTKSGNSDTITSNGYIYITGKYLQWDNTNDEEGWFLIADGEEKKLTVEDATNPEAVLAKTNLTFTAGEMVTLIFRTKKDGTLEQFTYGQLAAEE